MNQSVSKKILPLVILVVFVAIAVLVLRNPPAQPSRGDDRRPQMAVEVMAIEPAAYQVVLNSYGRVEPTTQSLLVAQVSGQVVKVSGDFESGGFFDKGDVLVSIDQREYSANTRIAEAGLLEAQKVLIEEQARSQLARDDWRRLGKTGAPDDLVLRKPQMLAAKAGVISAESNLAKAQLNLERCIVKAPYTGRVLHSDIDTGEVVAVNQRLGEIYATDAVEIRLPIRNRDLKFIDLPERYENATGGRAVYPAATLYSGLVAGQSWPAIIARTESAIDAQSRQLHVVAMIDNPFKHAVETLASGELPPQIKIGQYVTAKIYGKRLPAAMVIPVDAMYQGSFVYVVENGAVQRRQVSVAWQNRRDAIISAGLEAGAQLVITSLGQVVSGTPVSVLEPAGGTTAVAPTVAPTAMPTAGPTLQPTAKNPTAANPGAQP